MISQAYEQTFSNFDGRDNAVAFQAVRAWAAGEASQPWVVLWGGTGTGKSHLLAAARCAILERGDPDELPIYAIVPSLLDHIREGYDRRDYGGRFEAVREAPVLLLDDLGAENVSGWTEEALFKLFDHRSRRGLRTAVASNLLLGELEPRISSRLQDWRLSVCVRMVGEDRRLRSGSNRG